MTLPLREALLIDDSDADNFLHRRLLLSTGHIQTVTVRRDGKAALAYLSQAATPPDLLLLDINMPIMDGWQFLDAFERLTPRLRDAVTVAMLSTSLNPEDRERAESRDSVHRYIRKPLTADAFTALVEHHKVRYS